MTAGSANITAVVGETRYMHPSGVSDFWGMQTFAEMRSPNVAMVARDLSVSLPNPPGAVGEFYKLTFELDQVATALTCTITGAVDTTCVDATHTVPIPAGSLMSFELEVSAGATARRVQYGWRAVAP